MATLSLPPVATAPLLTTRAGLIWRIIFRAARTGVWGAWQQALDVELRTGQYPDDVASPDPSDPSLTLVDVLAGERIPTDAAMQLTASFIKGMSLYLEALPSGERIRSAPRLARLLHEVESHTPLCPYSALKSIPEADKASIWDAVLSTIAALDQAGEPLNPWMARVQFLDRGLFERWQTQLKSLSLTDQTRRRIEQIIAASPGRPPGDLRIPPLPPEAWTAVTDRQRQNPSQGRGETSPEATREAGGQESDYSVEARVSVGADEESPAAQSPSGRVPGQATGTSEAGIFIVQTDMAPDGSLGDEARIPAEDLAIGEELQSAFAGKEVQPTPIGQDSSTADPVMGASMDLAAFDGGDLGGAGGEAGEESGRQAGAGSRDEEEWEFPGPDVSEQDRSATSTTGTTRIEVSGGFAGKPWPRIIRVVGVLTGLIIVAAVIRLMARFLFGSRRVGRLWLEGDRVHLETSRLLMGRPIRSIRRSFGPRGVLTVEREVRYPFIHLFIGLFALCLGTLTGTIMYLDGRLAGLEQWMETGLYLVLGGLVVDFVFTVLGCSRPGKSTLSVTYEPGTTIRLTGVDQAAADRLMEALVSAAHEDHSNGSRLVTHQ